MNCDECQERVFELIEREAVEPEAVREVLVRCPECRALFDEMKAALADASLLPLEEPPPEVDAAVLRAARERFVEGTTPPRRWYQSPQWAVAAAALLAIGIGVWAIPHREPVVMEDGPAGARRGAQTSEPTSIEQAPPAPKSIVADASPSRGKRAAKPRRKEAREEAAQALEAEAIGAARRAPVAGTSLEMASADSDERAARMKDEDKTMSAECEALLAELERDRSEGVEPKVDAEDALAIGRCYQSAGNVAEARRWFTRAASDPKTRRRATRALKALPAP